MYSASLQLLQASPVTDNPQITDLKTYGRNAFRVKIRAAVGSTLIFQIWLNHNPRHTRYAYQLFGQGGTVLCWDNAPHYPHVGMNFPHHLHKSEDKPSHRPCKAIHFKTCPWSWQRLSDISPRRFRDQTASRRIDETVQMW